MKKHMLIAIAFAVLTAYRSAGAGDSDWEFSAAPYAWLVGIKGEIGPEANPASVDVQFSDLTDRFDWGAIGAFETRYRNRWIGIVEGLYAELDESGTAPQGGPNMMTPPGGPLDVEMDMSLGTAYIGYRTAGSKATFDCLVGGRWLYTKSYLRFPKTMTRKQDWIDPIVGVRIFAPFSSKGSVSLEADLGGFGIGSDLVWQVVPLAAYRFSDTLAGRVGYRYLDIDYKKGNYALDVAFQGWLVGAVIDF